MYDFIHDISLRPEPFSRHTVKQLWTKPHLSRQMLAFHLNQETDLASRRISKIDQVVNWIDSQVYLSGKNLCDLGCGPGLYTERFSKNGALVTGVDFSKHSLNYAKKHSNQKVNYVHADYLEDSLPGGFDIITLIYTDLCVLSASQRGVLYRKIKKMLNPGGCLIFDVANLESLEQKQEITCIEDNLMDGFWSDNNYVGIQKSFKYKKLDLFLDRYIIIEEKKSWQIFNWFQHFSAKTITKELHANGFDIKNLTGSDSELNENIISIIASPS